MCFFPKPKKRQLAIFPLRVFSPPRRLTSEFGMGSGVSAWLSPPLRRNGTERREGRAGKAGPLRTECHCPCPAKIEENCAKHRRGRTAFRESPGEGRSPRAIGATCLCLLPGLQRSSIERVTCPCPYPLSEWEAYCRERLLA